MTKFYSPAKLAAASAAPRVPLELLCAPSDQFGYRVSCAFSTLALLHPLSKGTVRLRANALIGWTNSISHRGPDRRRLGPRLKLIFSIVFKALPQSARGVRLWC
jgi:hypothetical protein